MKDSSYRCHCGRFTDKFLGLLHKFDIVRRHQHFDSHFSPYPDTPSLIPISDSRSAIRNTLVRHAFLAREQGDVQAYKIVLFYNKEYLPGCEDEESGTPIHKPMCQFQTKPTKSASDDV